MAGSPLGEEAGPLSLSLFRLGKELHRSGSGAVFEATVLRTGVPVAIKRKDTSELGDRKLIEHEALLLETLSHPNVAVCLGSFVERGSFHIVLEFADRGDLGQLIQIRHRARQHLSEQDIWGLFTQVCAGVACIHGQRIIHRDLKPRNVLLYAAPPPRPGYRGHRGLRLVAKIADLGVSRQLGATTEMATTFYGTPLYISPELCRNQPYSAKTDVWSLGVMLYELAALRPPFFGYSIVELAGSITRGTYDALPPSYSNTLRESVHMMLNLSDALRPSVDQYCRWLGHRLKPDRADAEANPDPEPTAELESEPEHRVEQDNLPAAATPNGLVEDPQPQPAHGRCDARPSAHAQVHHAWSARHRRPPETRGTAEGARVGRTPGELAGSRSESMDGREQDRYDLGRQESNPIVNSNGTEQADVAPLQLGADQPIPPGARVHGEARYPGSGERQQPPVAEAGAVQVGPGVSSAELPDAQEPQEPPTRPASASSASNRSMLSARDRRLQERQISYSARHAHQIMHVQAARGGTSTMPRQRPDQYAQDAVYIPGSRAGAPVSSQLSRLRSSMAAQPLSTQLDESTDDTDNGIDGIERALHPYTSSGGSSSGTSLVHRGYAASLGVQQLRVDNDGHHDHGGPAATGSRSGVVVHNGCGDDHAASEVEVAGLASQRTSRLYEWPSDRGDQNGEGPQPQQRAERPSTASTLRSPYAWG